MFPMRTQGLAQVSGELKGLCAIRLVQEKALRTLLHPAGRASKEQLSMVKRDRAETQTYVRA